MIKNYSPDKKYFIFKEKGCWNPNYLFLVYYDNDYKLLANDGIEDDITYLSDIDRNNRIQFISQEIILGNLIEINPNFIYDMGDL